MKKAFLLSTICALISFGSIFTSPAQTQAIEKGKQLDVNNSASDKGIIFTIDSFAKSNGELIIHYTVTSKKSKLKESKLGYQFMDRPHFYVNQKYLNVGFRENQTKISDYKFKGFISIGLHEIKDDHFNFTIVTDKIADKTGVWKLDIKV